MTIFTEKEYACNILENFLEGASGDWDFDDWISIPSDFNEIEVIKRRIWSIARENPDKVSGGFCGEVGTAQIREIIAALRNDIAQGQ